MRRAPAAATWDRGAARHDNSLSGVRDRIPRPAKAVQRARPRDEPERFVLRPPFGVTLADAFARLDYGGVERVMRQRQFRPNLAQAQLPQPPVRASGADCRS